VYCRTCGRPLPPAATLCPACGAPVEGPLTLPPVPSTRGSPGAAELHGLAARRVGRVPQGAGPADHLRGDLLRGHLRLSVVIGLFTGTYNAALHLGTQPSGYMLFVSNILSLGLSLVLLPVTWGIVMYALNVLRGEMPANEVFLSGYGRPWQVVLACLAPLAPVYVSILAWLPFLPAGEHQLERTAAHGDPVFGVALLLFFIPMTLTAAVVTILLGVRWCLAPLLVIDRGNGGFAALKASSDLTRGSRAQVFFLWLLNIPLSLAAWPCAAWGCW